MDNPQNEVQLSKEDDPHNLPAPTRNVAMNYGGLNSYLNSDDVLSRSEKIFGMPKDRVKRLFYKALQVIENSPDPDRLYQCDPRTHISAIHASVLCGLEIDSRGLAYLIPRFNKHKKTNEAKFMPSYKGYVYRLRERLPCFDIHYAAIREGDVFNIRRQGNIETYEHTPKEGNIFKNGFDELSGAFCFISYAIQHSTSDDLVMCSKVSVVSRAEIEKAKNTAESSKVWEKWPDPQIYKTAIKRCCALNFATEVEDIEEMDNQLYGREEESEKQEGNYAAERPSIKDIEEQFAKGKEEKQPVQIIDVTEDDQPQDTPTTEAPANDSKAVSGQEDDEFADLSEMDVLMPMITPEPVVAGDAMPKPVEQPAKYVNEPITNCNDLPSMEVWDMQTIYIGGLPNYFQFESAMDGGNKLLEIIAEAPESESYVQELIEKNRPILNALIEEKNMALVDKIHSLVAKKKSTATKKGGK